MTSGLIIFVKNPELGKAKTRVAASVGVEKALEVYRSLLKITKDTVLKLDTQKYLFYAHHINLDDDWDNAIFQKDIQSSGDLGDKMLDAFTKVLVKCGKAIIIGSDCPYISPEIINSALDSLEQNDVVIGPADDGGYYLLGLKSLCPEIFLNMTWSDQHVLSETISRLKKLKMSYKLLPVLTDVDHWEDWEAYLSTLKE